MGSFKISLNNIIIITFFYFLRIFYFLKNQRKNFDPQERLSALLFQTCHQQEQPLWYCQTGRLTIRLVALVQQGTAVAVELPTPWSSRCKVTCDIRCLVISSFVKSYPVLLNHIQFFMISQKKPAIYPHISWIWGVPRRVRCL